MKILLKLSVVILFSLTFLILPYATSGGVYSCTYHSYQRCLGNNLYWYDSCGNQQDIAQYCQNGCYNNSCQNYNNYNYNNYSSCASHAYRLCSGNNLYWYDSCGNQQDIYASCYSGQICQYGRCISAPLAQDTYRAYSRTACYGASIYWYDSLGVISGLYKNCRDNNSCTLDSCYASKCSNVLKCDGSACSVGSSDYNTYCSQNGQNQTPGAGQSSCGNGLCEPNLGETLDNCSNDCKTSAAGLVVSFFAKENENSSQWQKTGKVGSNGQIYFMVSVTNNSSSQINDVVVSANVPTDISFLGNLKIDGTPVSGDIGAGVNIGPVAASGTKLITFEGKTQRILESSTKPVNINVNVQGTTAQSDSVFINISPEQSTAAVSGAPATSGFWNFLKRWYLWIFGVIVLVFLFVIVFRRLSSEA